MGVFCCCQKFRLLVRTTLEPSNPYLKPSYFFWLFSTDLPEIHESSTFVFTDDLSNYEHPNNIITVIKQVFYDSLPYVVNFDYFSQFGDISKLFSETDGSDFTYTMSYGPSEKTLSLAGKLPEGSLYLSSYYDNNGILRPITYPASVCWPTANPK